MRKGSVSKNTSTYKKYAGKDTNEFTNFYEKIACARINYSEGTKKKRGLSLTDAAKKIGISVTAFKKIEVGEIAVPNTIIVHKLEKLFKFKVGELAQLLVENKKGA